MVLPCLFPIIFYRSSLFFVSKQKDIGRTISLSSQVLRTSIAEGFTASLGNTFLEIIFFFPNTQQELSKLQFLAIVLWHCLALLRRAGFHHACKYKIVGDCSYTAFSALLSAWINPALSASPHIPKWKCFVWLAWGFSLKLSGAQQCLGGSLRSESCTIRISGGKRGRELALFSSVLSFTWKYFVSWAPG